MVAIVTPCLRSIIPILSSLAKFVQKYGTPNPQISWLHSSFPDKKCQFDLHPNFGQTQIHFSIG